MALRKIVQIGESVLRKKCKVVEKIDEKIIQLLDDMADTMYESDGVGLAAPQVGILKRIFVVDAMDGAGSRVFINPEILEKSGEQTDEEGCLSLPGRHKPVKRANKIKIKALDVNGNEFVLDAEEFLARAIQHEYDHLEGVLFIDHEL